MFQWSKNALVFVPLILAHQWGEVELVINTALAFLSFSFGASALYLINDIIDVDADRLHPVKKHRPFAAGLITARTGKLIAALLLFFSISIGLILPDNYLYALSGYLFFSSIYSLRLKSIELLDVVILASLYTTRIGAGAAATGLDISFWLAAFSIFIFFSLAMIKRYSELYNLLAREKSHATGRGYTTKDLHSLSTMGVASGYISVLIMALYINDPGVTELYSTPMWLWLICPAILFWLYR